MQLVTSQQAFERQSAPQLLACAIIIDWLATTRSGQYQNGDAR
jgi:hypothetical protein